MSHRMGGSALLKRVDPIWGIREARRKNDLIVTIGYRDSKKDLEKKFKNPGRYALMAVFRPGGSWKLKWRKSAVLERMGGTNHWSGAKGEKV